MRGGYGGEGRSAVMRRLGWALIVAGLLALVLWGVVTGQRVMGHARSLQGHVEQLEGLAGGLGWGSLEAAGPHLAGMRGDLEAIGGEVGFLLPAGRLLGWLPGVGGDLAAASDLLQMAYGLAAAGERMGQALGEAERALQTAGLGGLGGEVERALPALAAAGPALREAQGELGAAAQARGRIEAGRLSPRAAGWVARVDGLVPGLELAVAAGLLAPRLLGADGARTYLVLAQNNQELRATGGFISGVGELRVEGGRLQSLDFRDSYAVDNWEVPHEGTPPDFQWTLFGELWLFRDANWDADFPTSARRALEIYERDRGVAAEGVITLDLAALELLVGAVGPIAVEGIGEPVTAANVVAVVQEQWGGAGEDAGQDWWLHRKDFMGQIAAATLKRLMEGPELDRARLARAVQQALAEKHMLVYLADAEAARLVHERGWDGALPAWGPGMDGLWVVDSNVGFNKVDARVERSIVYRVDLGSEGGPVAEVAVTYHNRSRGVVEGCVQESRYGDDYADMMERCYWNYVRVYVPGGSRLLAGPEIPWPAGSLAARYPEALPGEPFGSERAEGGWAVWTAFFDLAPGASRTLAFRYELPPWVQMRDAEGVARYELQVLKQPGTEAVPLQVELVLPPGAEVIEAVPADLPSASTDLGRDRAFRAVYREGRLNR
jgi:hypothetical protein